MKELRQFAEKADIPVVTTLLGIGGFPASHPLANGWPGMHGFVYSSYSIDQSDLIIGIGNRFDDRCCGKFSQFAPKAKIVHIDIDPAEIGKNVRVDVPIVGDVKRVLAKLTPEIGEVESRAAWHQQIATWKEQYPPKRYPDDTPELFTPQVIRGLYEETGGKALLVADVGQHQMFAAQHYPIEEPRQWFNSGGKTQREPATVWLPARAA